MCVKQNIKHQCITAFWSGAILIALLFVGCRPAETTEDKVPVKVGKNNRYYGGIFRFNLPTKMNGFHPLFDAADGPKTRVASSIFEGLTRLSPVDLDVEGALAEDWTITDDAKTFTFYIRQGVYFHDDSCFIDGKGRELNAYDIAYCLTEWCRYDVKNITSSFVVPFIEGAQDFHDATKNDAETPGDVSGIEVVDTYTLRLRLTHSFLPFLKVLSMPGGWVYPKEIMHYYGERVSQHPVGTGSFCLSAFDEHEIRLKRHEKYWDLDEYGNELPFMDSVCIAQKPISEELPLYKEGDLDVIYVGNGPAMEEVQQEIKETPELLDSVYKIQSKLYAASIFFVFDYSHEVFRDVRVRQAFNLALDKHVLHDSIFSMYGVYGRYGIIPPTIKGYPSERIANLEMNVERARTLLSEAGYPGGKGFPEVLFQSFGGPQGRVLWEKVQHMLWDNLNIKLVTPETSKSGRRKASFYTLSWIVDYPDPDNFLCLFNQSSNEAEKLLKKSNYHNDEFNALLLKARKETNEYERMQLYAQAEAILMEEVPVVLISYRDFKRILNPKVRNFPANSMNLLNFSEVYKTE